MKLFPVPRILRSPGLGLRLVLCAVTLLSSVTALAAAAQIVAPAELRELLSQHLSLTGNEPQDDTARATLERRWRKEASELLATEGYFSPHVELRNSEAGLVLQLEPGQRSQIASVSIEIRGAITDQRRQQLIAAWGLPAATAFRQTAWDDAKQGILRELMTVDYAAARLISSQAEVNVETAQVDLKLVYDAGPRYRYGEIRIVGLQRYPQSLVERYNKSLHPGEAYHQEELLALQGALQNTPYFSSVNVELEHLPEATEETAEILQVPVIIRLRERAPFNIALGAGVSSNTGARVEGNFRSADFLHRAWELSSGARIEQLRQSVYADVFLPPSADHRDSVGSVIEKSEIQGLGIERVAFAASRVQSRGSIEQRLGMNWQHERQTPDHATSTVNRALAATGGWVWRHADDPLDASEGIVAQLQLAGAAKSLLSDQNFMRSYFRYSQGIPLGKSDGLLLRGELGVTAAPSRQGIPQDYLFRAGGSNSVRGYSYQSLGVKEGAATLGGRYLLSVSAEYTHWLDARWGVATFVDAGQAADNRDVLKLAQGYGVGARWKSPAGPLAIDLAWGQLEKKFHLHFSLAVPF